MVRGGGQAGRRQADDVQRRGRRARRTSSRRSSTGSPRAAHRHPRLPRAGPRPGAGHARGRCRASSSPSRARSPTARRKVAQAAVDEVLENASRILEERELDVVWVSRDPRRGPVLRVAPMSVAMMVRDKVFGDRTVVLTSRDPRAGRHVRRRGRHDRAARRRGAGVARARRRQPVRLPAAGASPTSPSTSRRPAATGWRPRRSTRSRPSSGPPAAAPSGCSRRCGRPRRPPRRCASAQGFEGDVGVPLPGRGPDHHPRAPVRPRPADLPVRHAVAVAGRRRPGSARASS